MTGFTLIIINNCTIQNSLWLHNCQGHIDVIGIFLKKCQAGINTKSEGEFSRREKTEESHTGVWLYSGWVTTL